MPNLPRATSPWSPFRHPVFRALWIAGLVSDLGAWMHEVGEAWLMTSLSPSPMVVALLQSADSLAVFLIALPAGALADVLDRRRLGIITQAWLAAGAGALALLTLAGAMTPGRLLALAFCMGLGAAMDGALWPSIVAEVVPAADLPAAVTLGGLEFNLARSVGPAIGGLVIAATGVSSVFLLNALSFVFVLTALARWRRPAVATIVPGERWSEALVGGLRYVRHSPELIAIFVRGGLAIVGASGLLALLPVVARRDLGLGAAGFGMLIGFQGAGAVLAAVLLPKLRSRTTADATHALACLTYAGGLLALALAHRLPVVAAAMLVAGFASMSLVSNLNIAVQTSSPSWVRSRVLSVYILVFQGALGIGSAIWGTIAARTSPRTALAAAAIAIVAGLVARVRFPIEDRGPDLALTAHWPKPMLLCDPAAEAGPVLVTIEYRVREAHADEFFAAASAVGQRRKRDGAFRWDLFRDPAQPDRYLEAYFVGSWAEHLRQHERVTGEVRELEERVRTLLVEGTEPVVTHLLAVEARRGEGERS